MEHVSPAYVEKQKILLKCIDLEIAVSAIYRDFMLLFPAEGAFWAQLAREEEEHARLYMAGDIMRVTGEHAGIRFPPTVLVARTLEFAEQIRDLIGSRPITLQEALDMALKLEKTVAESIIFDLPETDNPVIANLRKIIADTEAHADRIERFRMEKGFSFPV